MFEDERSDRRRQVGESHRSQNQQSSEIELQMCLLEGCEQGARPLQHLSTSRRAGLGNPLEDVSAQET